MNRASNYESSELSRYINDLRDGVVPMPFYPFRITRRVRTVITISNRDRDRLDNSEIDCYTNKSGRIIIVEPSIGLLSDIIWNSGIGEMNISVISTVINEYLSILMNEFKVRRSVKITIGDNNLTKIANDVNSYTGYYTRFDEEIN